MSEPFEPKNNAEMFGKMRGGGMVLYRNFSNLESDLCVIWFPIAKIISSLFLKMVDCMYVTL